VSSGGRTWWNRERVVQFLLFGLVGGVSAGIDAGGFALLLSFGVLPLVASPISFLSSFAFNFLANRSLVYRAKPSWWQLVRYTTLVVVNTFISTGLVAGGIVLGMSPIFAKIGSIALIAMWNFVILRLWVFRSPSTVRRPKEDQDAVSGQ
jgi:putative flippase GtrA